MRRFWLGALLALAGCVPSQNALAPEVAANPYRISKVATAALPGWPQDDAAAALLAFTRSCKAIDLMPPDKSLGGAGVAAQQAGQAGQWQQSCALAKSIAPNDATAARQFFEANFTAYRIDSEALVTGYFEPEYPGSKNRAPGFTVPLYAKPATLALADLPRAAIDDGALYRKTPVTAYLADPVDAFMLQIQGSGRILLKNGQTLRVGFDGQNGQPYTPIGRILVQEGDLAADQVSFQSISTWLKTHPERARAIMEQNARYVYLRPLGGLSDDQGAPGTLGVPLTAGRSLAIDKNVIPLGMPVFVATTDPLTHAPLDRLTIAQDTGGGIHGPQAADLFFGAGPDAEMTAGSMRQPGTLYLLIPTPPPSA